MDWGKIISEFILVGLVDFFIILFLPATLEKNDIPIELNDVLLLVIIIELAIGLRYIAIGFIHLYQSCASAQTRNACLYYPSCSHYSEICYRHYGFVFGSIMTVERLLRCKSPNGGFDYPGCGPLPLFNRNTEKKPVISVLKNESPADVFMWMHPSEDFNTNSVVVVEPNEEVLFIIDGRIEQVLQGGRKYNLETENYPFLSKLRNRSTGGVSAFPCKVVFIRKEHALELKWGTDSPIQVRDPVYKISTQIQARGSYTLKIDDSALFYTKLCGNVILVDREYVRVQFRSITSEKIKSIIGNYVLKSSEEILGICAKQSEVASYLKSELKPYIAEYGIELVDLFVSALDIPQNDPSRARLDELYTDKAGIVIQGDDWERIQKRDILIKMAENEGVGGNAAMLFGMNTFSGNNGLTNMEVPPQKMTKCFSCGEDVPIGSKFCPKCGSNIVESTITCECGASVSASSKFCPNCGKPMNVVKKCPKCGSDITAGSAFCSECGFKI